MPRVPGYIIATHPRSGSNYFCQLLASTGVLGRPAEFFNEGLLRSLGLDPADPASLQAGARQFVEQGATANGIRALKLFWFDLGPVVRNGLTGLFAGHAWVMLDRADKLAQAVSISRALRTGRLTSEMAIEERGLEFDYADIRLRLERLHRSERSWRGFFERRNTQPLVCRYEDLCADPQREIDRVAALVGLAGEARIDPDQITLEVQRDEVSADWQARFREQAEREDPELLNLF